MILGPAKLAQLDSRKSQLKEGYDADFVIWVIILKWTWYTHSTYDHYNFQDPLATFTISKDDIMYKNKLSPYLNRTLSGVVKQTIVGGQVVFEDGSIVCEGPVGKLLL